VGEPVQGSGIGRTDWRDGFATAADLALVGIAVTVAALPLVTAGAAVRTGSIAVRHVVDGEALPSAVELWRAFRRAVAPGLVASVVVLAAATLLAVDLAAVAGGRVPGGPAVLVVTVLVAAGLAAFAALTVVRLGHDPAGTWRAAARWAGGTARRRPGVAAACAGVLVFATGLAALVPPTAPLLAGYVLFALHVVTRRLAS
jgi:hypothetical protein